MTATTRTTKLSKRAIAVTAALAAALLIAAGTYLADQYRSAIHPGSLADLPAYPYTGSALPLESLPAAQRGQAEATLRQIADTVEPGYHASAERFMACTGEFVWDAVRSTVNGYLAANGFHIDAAGQLPTAAGDPAYITWARTNHTLDVLHAGVIHRVLAVGLQQPITSTTGPTAHVYAYFELTPQSQPAPGTPSSHKG